MFGFLHWETMLLLIPLMLLQKYSYYKKSLLVKSFTLTLIKSKHWGKKNNVAHHHRCFVFIIFNVTKTCNGWKRPVECDGNVCAPVMVKKRKKRKPASRYMSNALYVYCFMQNYFHLWEKEMTKCDTRSVSDTTATYNSVVASTKTSFPKMLSYNNIKKMRQCAAE